MSNCWKYKLVEEVANPHDLDELFLDGSMKMPWSGMKNLEMAIVTTLTLGSRPRQGLAKVRANSEAQESHFMLWECGSVGECEGMNFHTPK
jgi:hypothetical protein